MNLLDCSKYSMWDYGSYSTQQVYNKETIERQTKQKLDFLWTSACTLTKLQFITCNFIYCRRNNENPVPSLQSLHHSYLPEIIPNAAVTCKDRYLAWMTSRNFPRANLNTSLSSTKFKHAFKYLVSL